jgi:hypothetical protein
MKKRSHISSHSTQNKKKQEIKTAHKGYPKYKNIKISNEKICHNNKKI